MSRPTDWDAIGLDGDPTPGDPARLHTVATSLSELGRTAREIDSGMEAVVNKAGPDAFAGETADELRNQISGRLRGFVQSIADAFEWSSSALSTYADAMSSAQSQADSALDQGRGLNKDDPNRDTLAANAKAAGSALSEAARTATSTIRKASNHIKSPVSGCAEFWEIFQWIAIALIIPALIFGGPVALVALGVNLTLFIKTAVDFFQGKASGLELFLSALGMIAPTTRAIPIGSLLSKGFQLLKGGLKAGGIATLDLFKGLLTGMTKPFVVLPSLHDLVLATGSWTKAGGLWVSNIAKAAGQLGVDVVTKGALLVVNGFKAIPAFVQGIGPALGKFGVASAQWFKGEFGGSKWLRVILPAEGDEIGAFGLGKAMKIALIDRGIFGRFRFGAVSPTAQALGAGASHIPVPGAPHVPTSGGSSLPTLGAVPPHGVFPTPAALRNINPLVDMPLTGLADTRIQVGQWTGTLGPVSPHIADAGGITASRFSLSSPPSLVIGTELGGAIHFSAQATTRMDALLDMPIRQLSSMNLGSWAHILPTPEGLTAGAGVSALPAHLAGMPTPPSVHVDVAGAKAGTPGTGITQIPTDIASAGVVAKATDLVVPSPAPALNGTPPPAVPAGLVATPPPATSHALNPGGIVSAPPTIDHTAVHGPDLTPNPQLNSALTLMADGHTMATVAHHTSLDFGPPPKLGHAFGDVTPSPAAAHTLDVGPPAVTPHTVDTGSVPPASLATRPSATPHTAGVNAPAVMPNTVTSATAPPTSLTTPSPAHFHTAGVGPGNVDAPTGGAGVVHAMNPDAGVTGATTGIGDSHVMATTAHHVSPDPGPVPRLGHTGNNAPAAASASEIPTVPAPATTRVDAALNLLDGPAVGGKAPRPGPAVHGPAVHGPAVHGPAADGPVVTGPAPAGAGDKAFAGAPAHVTPPSPAPRAMPAAPPRLTGAELDQAWAAHDARIGALFGSADDPLRAGRTDAWAEFVQARYDLARVQGHLDVLRARPGEPSSGVSPAVLHVQASVDAAQQRFDAALRGLREQGLNPVAVDRAISELDHQSVLERPRLLGGALPVIRVEGADQARLVEVVPLTDAAGRPEGMSVHITYRQDGVDVRVDTATEPNGSGGFAASVADDGHLIVHDVQTGFGRHFDSAGVLTAETVPLRGADGRLLGDDIVVHHGPDGVTGHELSSPDPSPHTVTPTADGGFRVDRPAGEGTGATYRLFDANGVHQWDGHRIHTGGADMGAVEFPAPGTTGTTRWLGPDGGPVAGFSVIRETDAAGHPTAIKIQEGADGAFTRYDIVTGDAIEIGTPLRGAGGTADGRFAVIPLDGGAPGHLENLTGTTLPGQVFEQPGGGIRVQYDAAGGRPMTYQRFDADNVHVADGRQLLDQNGNPLGFADVNIGAQDGRFLDTHWTEQPGQTVHIDVGADGTGTIRVTDTATQDYRTFDAQTGHLGDHAVMMHGHGGPLNKFGVTRYPGPGTDNPAPLHFGLDPTGVHLDDLTFHGDDGWRLTTRGAGVRTGEFQQFGLDGRLTGQRVNVIENGRPVPGRHFELAFTPDGNTWRLLNGNETAVTGLLHSGEVDVVNGAGRIRLVAKPGTTTVEIFDRRPLPGGGFVDAVRRTDVNGFGRVTGGQRTRWTQYTAEGEVTGWGVREFGTLDGKAWQDVDRFNRTVHEFRQGIDGSVFAHKTGDGWSWTRLDGNDAHLASGTRTHDIDGGWTDTLAGGTVVQRQWGPARLPSEAGHYSEVVLDANGAPTSVTINRDGQTITKYLWKGQSKQGKSTGALEELPGGSILETHRWSEQRPPQWVRRGLMGIGDEVWNARPYLKGDTRYQMFTWTRTDLATGAETHGFRFTSMNEGTLDIAVDGTVMRSTIKLDNGKTLTVGDSVRPPAGVNVDPQFAPWTEGSDGLSGHRVNVDGAGDGRIWEDRFDPAAGEGDWYHPHDQANWQVARIGYTDGTVREFRIGPAKIVDQNVWVTKDPHGAIIGRSDLWQVGDRTRPIEMAAPNDTRWNWTGYNGRTDTQKWYWTDHGATGGAPGTGPARYMRGYNGATPFDDSFIHFERTGDGIQAVRVRNVLGDGAYVDSWRVASGDTHTWQWAKYDKTGNPIDYPGTRTRQWWDATMNDGQGGWTNDWFKGATRFRDMLTPPGPNAEAIVVREIPVTAVNGRIREFLAQGDVHPSAGAWREFDHGTVVRERTSLPEGGFLEKDSWLGQWRRYDGEGNIIAQRTSSGFVFELGADTKFRLTGRELDFRGPIIELRGWGRRIRDANRLEWEFGPSGVPRLEATYKPQWRLIFEKAAVEFLQDFVLEFAANLAINAIVADIQGKPFTGQDALRAFANASVGAGIKTTVGTFIHENKFDTLRHTGDWKMGLSNIDGGKPWNRHPSVDNWSSEWAGNESPTRWRSGTYDFTYGAAAGFLSGWVTGSMNAAVWGISDSNGHTVVLTGGAAVGDGLIGATAGVAGTISTGLGKSLYVYGMGSRAFHRGGLGDFLTQFAFKFPDKLAGWKYTTLFRGGLNPPWYQNDQGQNSGGGAGGPK
jgi:hypothetical protein